MFVLKQSVEINKAYDRMEIGKREKDKMWRKSVYER
jgi:hypothetical protein